MSAKTVAPIVPSWAKPCGVLPVSPGIGEVRTVVGEVAVQSSTVGSVLVGGASISTSYFLAGSVSAGSG